jgi:hypothetical protein
MHTESSGVTASCAGSFRQLAWVSYQKANSGGALALQGLVACLLPKERRGGDMKKLIATLVTLTLLSLAALPAAAQTRTRCSTRSVATYVSSYRGRTQSRYATRYNRNTQYQNNAYRVDANGNNVYDANGNYVYDDPYYGQNRSVWEEHRDKITTAGGAVGGAVLGGLFGGKKGAVIGAIAGGAGAAIYTYKIRDKNYRY